MQDKRKLFGKYNSEKLNPFVVRDKFIFNAFLEVLLGLSKYSSLREKT